MYAMRQQQEHDLIERIAGGDTEAFAVLVDRYAHTVHALVARIVVTAEDAASFARLGNAVASLCVRKRGAIPAMPERADVEALLSE